MCFESYLKLTENPLTEQSKLIQLETRNKTQATIIGDVIREKNKAKKEYEKQTQIIKANLKNHYNQNLLNLRKENRELNKQRNTIKQKYNSLLRQKRINVNNQLEKENETLKKLLDIKRNNTPVPEWLRKAVFERDNKECVECGHKGSKDNPLTVDHRLPRFIGGPNIMDNLKTLCEDCNKLKGPGLDETILKEAK